MSLLLVSLCRPSVGMNESVSLRHCMLGTIFCICGKTLGGLKALQLKNAQVVFQQGVEVIQSLVQLRIVRHGRTPAQAMCGIMKDHFRRATMKGVRDPATETQMSGMTVGTKTMTADDECKMKVGTNAPGDCPEYRQSSDLLEQIHKGHLKIMRLRADAFYGPAGYENITVRMESQVLSIMKGISEETARCEFESMERETQGTRYSTEISSSKVQSEKIKDMLQDLSIRL